MQTIVDDEKANVEQHADRIIERLRIRLGSHWPQGHGALTTGSSINVAFCSAKEQFFRGPKGDNGKCRRTAPHRLLSG